MSPPGFPPGGARPPRLAEALLGRCLLPGLGRDALLGDMQEAFRRRAITDGRVVATRWYWAQALRLGVQHLWERGIGRRIWHRRIRTPHGNRTGGESIITTLLQDLPYGLRSLRKNPGFGAVIILTLSLGIGANTAIFSVVNTVLLRPLPYDEPDRVVQIWGSNERRGVLRWGTSLHDFEDWRAQSETFSEIAVYWSGQTNLAGPEQPQRITYSQVSPGLFTVLGVAPAMGRTFTESENLPGNDGVVVVSEPFW